jgi:hypothetical protein
MPNCPLTSYAPSYPQPSSTRRKVLNGGSHRALPDEEHVRLRRAPSGVAHSAGIPPLASARSRSSSPSPPVPVVGGRVERTSRRSKRNTEVPWRTVGAEADSEARSTRNTAKQIRARQRSATFFSVSRRQIPRATAQRGTTQEAARSGAGRVVCSLRTVVPCARPTDAGGRARVLS